MRGSMNKFLRKTNISEDEALKDQSSEKVILDLLNENDFENNIELNSGSELSSTFKIINSLKENTVESPNMESNFGISDDFSLDLNCEFPTDRGKFPDIIKNSNLKRQIISFGPCKPNIKFPLSTMYFEDSEDSKSRKFSVEYYFTTNLSGQKIPRGWLCYSIILDKVYCESCWLFADRKHSYFKSNWINGINDWQHLTLKINKHESSIQHIEAVKLRNTALRGNERKLSETSPSEGNFIRTVRLLAEFDPVLNSLLLTEQSQVKYLSWKIQNELIEILATNLQQLICEEIRSAQCFSIIIDSTQDITKIDQVSFIFRYTIVDYKESKLEIKESFLGFYPLDKHDAEGHVNLIKSVLSTHNLDISKCRGQGYDGASVMSGCFSGVQKRISDIIPNASFVHCAAHNLNLVSSAPRWATLALGDDVAKIVLKKVCTTRWESRHNAVFALKFRYKDVLKSLTISKKMQSIETNLHIACEYLQSAVTSIENLRDNYECLVNSATDLCNSWGIPVNNITKRKVFSKTFFGDLDGDKRHDITQENLKVKVFLPVIDTALVQLKYRFLGLQEVVDKFNFLQPQNMLQFSEENLVKATYDFIIFYEKDISSDFTRQVLSIKEILTDSLSKIKSIKELAKCILENDLGSLYKDVLTACVIFTSLPVTVASAERSFSKLKIIKNYLRNSMAQDRLTNISILNIERNRTQDLNINQVIDNFANKKARKKNFLK
ncbi:52 kDa repressor of the inhibitor of the protein kinase-like [Melanaphis sacchari]|uniref:52 kDa repressor of the inhibitor of the protein kinase-like n=1 Tax=Melanaphis sacchari TaxID=742174 RepID=UPI000DC12DB2|nr:52 kDa repressor of the inhibitor of the protein kinase-like [Melanaphis sacchari]